MYNCKICNKKVNKLKDLSIHLFSHKIKLLDYYVKYENFKIPKCNVCGNDSKNRKGLVFYKTCGDKKCKSYNSKQKKHTSETKKIISDKRKKFLLSNPDKHPWKQKNKKLSTPCELFKKKLKKQNISFVEEYTPLDDRFYSIDISFPDIKIGIEINGNQHYNSDKTLKTYYQDRKNNIEKEGWKLYDVHYSKVYDDYFCGLIISNLNTKYNLDNIDLDFNLYKKHINTCICGKLIHKKSKMCIECNSIKNRKVIRPSFGVLNADIIKYGYSKTGRKYNVSDTTIKKWFKKYKNK